MPQLSSRPARAAQQLRRRAGALTGALATLALAGAPASCTDGSASPSGILRDATPPTVTVQQIAAPSDSVLAFITAAHDNVGLLQVHTRVIGPGFGGSYDTTYSSAVTDVGLPYSVHVPASVPTGTQVMVIAFAVDGARNSSKPDTALLTTGARPLTAAVVVSPAAGDTAVVDSTISISLSGTSPGKVRTLGYYASGVFSSPQRDSVSLSSPLPDSVAWTKTLSLTGASTGTLTITPFVVDSSGGLSLGTPVDVVVVASAGPRIVSPVHVSALLPAGRNPTPDLPRPRGAAEHLRVSEPRHAVSAGS